MIQLLLMSVLLYADTEVATHILINKADHNFRLNGTLTNDLKQVSAIDVNANGILNKEGVERRFGWRDGCLS